MAPRRAKATAWTAVAAATTGRLAALLVGGFLAAGTTSAVADLEARHPLILSEEKAVVAVDAIAWRLGNHLLLLQLAFLNLRETADHLFDGDVVDIEERLDGYGDLRQVVGSHLQHLLDDLRVRYGVIKDADFVGEARDP